LLIMIPNISQIINVNHNIEILYIKKTYKT